MVPLSEFKKALGPLAQTLPEEEVERIRDKQDQLANIMFDIWLREINATRRMSLANKPSP